MPTGVYPRRPVAERFWEKVDKSGECWEWIGGRYLSGYGNFGQRRAHRVSYEMAHGPIPKGLCVCHACDNPGCVNPDHLWLGTRRENSEDRDRKGRNAKGERIGSAKLTENDVENIRANRMNLTQQELADLFGVSQGLISRILSRQRWA